MRAVLGAVTLVACSNDGGSSSTTTHPKASSSPPAWVGVGGDPLPPLPAPVSTTTTTFATSDVCAQCHLAGDGAAVRDAKGRDVSPVGTWRTSAMGLAARDPYYLAAFADQLAAKPNDTMNTDALCTRCHSPAGSVELAAQGFVPTFKMLTQASADPGAILSRDGVTCTLCHQIAAQDLGTRGSFSGGFTVGAERTIFGQYLDPRTDPMKLLVDYTPSYGAHIESSALCATCHTVITNATDPKGNAGPAFPEQVPYLEWRASAFTNEPAPRERAATCQACHMPRADVDGGDLDVVIARSPAGLAPRKPFGRHGFAGANVQLARYGQADPAWFGVALAKADHAAQEAADVAMLGKAATLAIARLARTSAGIELDVRVTNETGHKLPTGYPSRRMFLHVKAGDVFESGATDAYGRFATGEPATFAPHLDVVDHAEQVATWESIPVDWAGKAAHRPLDAFRYAKDDRLLPVGYDPKNSFAVYMTPVGVEGDADWGSSDVVHYKIAKVPAGAPIRVELMFQTVRPSDVEALATKPTTAALRLFQLTNAAPLAPVVMASADAVAP